MCSICDDFNSKKITSEKAFELINDAMQDKSHGEKIAHLLELSALILDKDVPMPDRDEDLEKKWHDENHEK